MVNTIAGAAPNPDAGRHAGSRGRVLQLISSLEVGGAERLLVEYLKQASRLDPDGQVVVVMNDMVDPAMAAELSATGVPAYFMGRPKGRKDPRYLLALARFIRRHDIRIIHSHNFGSLAWGAACRLMFPWIKLVYTVHDTMTFENPRPARRLLQRVAADMTIAISDAVLAQLHRAGLTRAVMIHNGVDLARFVPPADSPAPAPGSIVCVGRLVPSVKGQDILIRAVRRLVDMGLDPTLTLIGPEVPTLAPGAAAALESLAGELGLAGRVRIETRCPDVGVALRRHQVFALPSRKEGFGLVIIEAMAARVPVVAADLEGPAELVRNGRNGLLFTPGSDAELAEAIACILRDPAHAGALVRAGAETAEAFDIEGMTRKYLAVYHGLVAARPGGRRVAGRAGTVALTPAQTPPRGQRTGS